MSNSNECAYPALETEIGIDFHPGLTKREAFAIAAMHGILSHSFGRGNPEECAIAALQNADALLKELDN